MSSLYEEVKCAFCGAVLSTAGLCPNQYQHTRQRLDAEAATAEGCSRCGFMALTGHDCPELDAPRAGALPAEVEAAPAAPTHRGISMTWAERPEKEIRAAAVQSQRMRVCEAPQGYINTRWGKNRDLAKAYAHRQFLEGVAVGMSFSTEALANMLDAMETLDRCPVCCNKMAADAEKVTDGEG